MLIRSPNGTYEFIDFRETAPDLAHQDMFVKNPILSSIGGLSIAVPGEIRGLELAYQRHGKLSWKELFDPAIHIARYGFKTTALLEKRLEMGKDWIMNNQAFKKVYAPNGTLAKEGDLILRPTLADTLEVIATQGADSFYKGDIAKQLVKTIQENGGIITLDDLENYKAVIRPTINTYYHGRKITTTTSPTSGPISLSIFNLLERFQLSKQGDQDNFLNIHRLIESFKFGYAFRTEMADPDFMSNQERMDELISKDWASTVRRNISDDQTFDPLYYQPKYDHIEAHGTMHLSVIDENDGAVALTSSVNHLFGSQVMDEVTGVIFNDQMDDFSIPNTPNLFGLYPSKDNYPEPGKRPLSSITPIIVERDGLLELAIGGSGGSMILTSVVNVILNVLDHGMDLYQAIDAPRLHHQLLPNLLILEEDQNVQLATYLKDRGHELFQLPPEIRRISAVQAVQRFANSTLGAVSDPRKLGLAAAY
ncbi:unnamed protein product [Cunninghamella echinulata]